jgi:hypothetical protein
VQTNTVFSNVAPDAFGFGAGANFKADKVVATLGFKKAEVSKISKVATSSVRFDNNMPELVRDRLEEIANTMNMVTEFFDGDPEKTVTWFRLSNPMLGDVSPRDMIRLGRYDRLRKFIINARTDHYNNQAALEGTKTSNA